MHVFLSLAQALALALGQGEAVEPEPAAPAAQEPAAPAADPPPAEPRPARSATPPAGSGEKPPPPPVHPGEPERAQAARAALAFVDALLSGDAAALAAASSERFSFDGEVRAGKDEIKRAWRAALADRDPSQRGALLDLELLPAADAVARLGAPPARLAPLAANKGGWVAIANVSRRPLVLFLAREGGRFTVTGLE
jgi:hypothetical protein